VFNTKRKEYNVNLIKKRKKEKLRKKKKLILKYYIE